MLSEEQFILKYDGKVIQGDPRRFLKAHENHIMLEEWKKLEKQGGWELRNFLLKS